jgi:uncharacterized protein (TIGR03000 family)
VASQGGVPIVVPLWRCTMRARITVFFLTAIGALLLVNLPAAISQDAAKKDAEKKVEKKIVAITVLVPQDDAALTFDDTLTKEKGVKRSFTTPPLDPIVKVNYMVKVTWKPNNYTEITRKYKVDIDPAKEDKLLIDLTKADPRWKDDIVVIYVPTPDDIVDAMCKLAKIGKDDTVFDLGCGDGRMVIRAVEKFGAKRGFGVDIDPERVAESRLNARKARIEDKVTFREGDVLKIDDIGDASVVLLYMGDDINLRLRPILQSKLKPGSRIVSHRFTMGDWAPKTTQKLKGADGDDYEIHLWVVGDKK